VYETAWHWSRFVRDSFCEEDRAIRSERRVFDVRCDALLIDLRGKEKSHPDLVDRKSYAFCQEVGAARPRAGDRTDSWSARRAAMASMRRSFARSGCATPATSCS
jgi:hypothetical protein